MFYKFPIIENINDVLPFIKDNKEILVVDKGDHTIINYAVAFPETFGYFEDGKLKHEYAIRRECRGLIFRNSDGKIIRRPYPKFFNLGEKDETQPRVINTILNEAVSLEKLDGSMVAFYKVEPTSMLIPGSKMGQTFITDLVNDFIKLNPNYELFSDMWINYGFTPIFEFCSRSQRIVIDYPEDRLVLTAIRCMESGNYIPYQEMVKYAQEFNIEVVQTRTFDQSCVDAEGVVIRTDEGHMVKMKTDHYVRIHKAKDKITVEKNALAAILNNEIDDVMRDLSQEDQNRVNALSSAIHQFLRERAVTLCELVTDNVEKYGDRKTFALSYGDNQVEKAATFKLWDNPSESYNYLMDQLMKSLTKEVNYNSFKETWGFNYVY